MPLGIAKVVTRNLRVPESPRLASEAAAGDGVFLRLMALPKGRGMLTRALRLLHAPPSLAEAVPGTGQLPLPRVALATCDNGGGHWSSRGYTAKAILERPTVYSGLLLYCCKD